MTVAGEVRVLVRYDVVPLPVTGSVRVTGTMVSAPFPPSPSPPSGLSVAFAEDDGEDGLRDVLELEARESESAGVDWLVLLLLFAAEVVELTGNEVGSYDTTVAVETVTVLVMPLRLRLGVELETLPDPLRPTELGRSPLIDDCNEAVEAVLGTEEKFRDETGLLLVCENVPETGTLPNPDEM